MKKDLTGSRHDSRRVNSSYLVFAILAGLMITGITLYSIWNEYRMTLDRERDSLIRISELVTEETRQLFSRVEFMLDTVDQWLLANPGCDPRFDPAFARLIETFRQSTDHRIDIRFVTSRGGLYYVPSKDTRPLSDVKDRQYFLSAMNGGQDDIFIAAPVKSRVTRIWGIPISKKLAARNADMAVVFAAIELPTLNLVFDSARPKPEGRISLHTTEGTLLACSPFAEDRMGQSYTGFASLQSMEDRQGLFTLRSEETGGHEYLYAHRSIPHYGLEILVSTRTSDLFSAWHVSIFFHLGIMVLILSTLGLFSVFVFRLVSRVSLKSMALEEANHYKDQIFSLLSHDLRGPLGSMLNFIDYLEENDGTLDGKDKKSGLTMLRQSGRNIQNLLENLLAWLKLSQNLAKCNPENLDARQAIQETCQLFDISLKQKGIKLDMDIPEDLRIHADQEMFKGIIRNILSNSIKATRQNSVLKIRAERKDSEVVLYIEDQGFGMSPEQLDELFSQDPKGDIRSGLGLVLVRNFVAAHSGRILAESKTGEGSTFIIYFPDPA